MTWHDMTCILLPRYQRFEETYHSEIIFRKISIFLPNYNVSYLREALILLKIHGFLLAPRCIAFALFVGVSKGGRPKGFTNMKQEGSFLHSNERTAPFCKSLHCRKSQQQFQRTKTYDNWKCDFLSLAVATLLFIILKFCLVFILFSWNCPPLSYIDRSVLDSSEISC
jgi:hypothetical protein